MRTAFILAGGEGRRMMPLTKSTPKPLIKISGVAMIDYIFKLLKKHEFGNIGVNSYYLKNKIARFVGSRAIVIEEKFLSGSAGAVKVIYNNLKPQDPFLVISSDMMVNFDLEKIYRFHLRKKSDLTICCYFRKKSQLFSKKSGQVIFGRRDLRVINFIERSTDVKSQWVNSSIYIFNPGIMKFIPTGKEYDIAANLIPDLLNRNLKVFAYPVNHRKYYQLGIDTPERILKAEEDIRKGIFNPA